MKYIYFQRIRLLKNKIAAELRDNYFRPQTEIPFKVEGIETLELSFDGVAEKSTEIEIGSIWLE